jgi:ubiquinone/menaquinone biosynthesis C-methylase UbiE
MKIKQGFIQWVVTTVACTLWLTASALAEEAEAGKTGNPIVHIKSKASILHLGSIDSFDVTEGGTRAAKLVLKSIMEKDPAAAQEAIEIYQRLIPNENFGGEYTALKWFCEYMLSPEDVQEQMLADPFVRDFYKFFSKKRFANLKEFLSRKYKLKDMKDKDAMEGQRREGFLQDFILFNNPVREGWEKSSRIIEVLNIQPGQKIADVGCGPGFFTVKFADLVGPAGKVYAMDTNPDHIEYVTDYVKSHKIKHVEPIVSEPDDIRVDDKVDLVFLCSLYHIIYATSSEATKDAFIGSIRKALKPDGRFVVVDNALVEDQTLPYHGPYIARDLIVAQFKHYGFELVETHQFIPQRYVLVFKPVPDFTVPPLAGPHVAPVAPDRIEVLSRASLMRVPSDLDPDITEGGNEAAKVFVKGIKKGNAKLLKEARDMYVDLIPRERIGDEYTAFKWICDYLLASDEERAAMTTDPMTAAYVEMLGGEDFDKLVDYIETRYPLDSSRPAGKTDVRPGFLVRLLRSIPVLGQVRRSYLIQDEMYFWRDFVLFNNPNREAWERTSKIIETIGLKPGDAVADVGSGPGCYTVPFSRIVGEKGHVFAVDTNERHLKFIDGFTAAQGIENITTVPSKFNDTCLKPDSVDTVFICSLYSIVYTTSMEKVKDEFVGSIRRALRKGGRLIIADNAVVNPPDLPYHGPFMARELIIAQMHYYGFELERMEQFTPQRYVLVFRSTDK